MSPEETRFLHPSRGLRCLKVERRRLRAQTVYGIPRALSPTLVLLQRLQDHDLDGFVVVRRSDITVVRSDVRERFAERVLRGERALSKVGRIRLPAIANWHALFADLGKRAYFVEVEAERRGEFYVGLIAGVRPNAVLLHFVDSVGTWDQELLPVPFRVITRVAFATRYGTVLQKYAARRPAI